MVWYEYVSVLFPVIIRGSSVLLINLLGHYNRVIPVEVGNDDGDGEGDAQSAADAADAGHQFARGSGGGDVTIAGAGHSDDGPVQGLRQGEEHRVRLILKITNAQDFLSQLMQTFSRA